MQRCAILKPVLGLTLLLAAAAPALAGPVLAPGQRLYLVKTEHFDIIFPEKSRPSAMRLASFADSVYDEVALKLASKVPKRIPVVITPDVGTFNGYTDPFPYMHIVLYDTSLDPGWTAFADNFRYLFLHELTHAVSLQIKAPWADFLSGIFGSWVAPGLLNTPEFMTEGVAVSFESADGIGGRANDPLVKERLRQDILENSFKTPIEASGIYDGYPGGDIYYEYGGLFNAYIQKVYGMEKYDRLWKAMGTIVLSLSFNPYEEGFYAAFHRTYGIPFTKAWEDFRKSLAIEGVVFPPEVLGKPDYGSAEASYGDVGGALAGSDACLFWVDGRSSRAMAMEVSSLDARASRDAEPVFDADASTAISDASPEAGWRDGRGSGTLLVSRARPTSDGRDWTETVAYDLAERRFLAGSSVPGMREARFFRDGCVGIVSRLHDTDLVYATKDGSKVLLAGSEKVMFACPAALDSGRVALIVAIDGKRRLGILDVDSGSLSLVLPEGGDEGLFDYVRQISAHDGRIFFNYDSDDRLYKLGIIDDRGIRLEAVDYSGGVFGPRVASGRVYYVGRFTSGDRICRYPGADSILGGPELAYSLEPFDPSPRAREIETSIAEEESKAEVGAYHPLAYANPFNEWFIYPDLAVIDRSFRLFSLFEFKDPMDANSASLQAGYDSAYPFADLTLQWSSQELPVALGADLADTLSYGASGPPSRLSSADAAATWMLPAYPDSRALELGLGGSVLVRADGASGSPYSWGRDGWGAVASGLAAWLGRIPAAMPSTYRGLDLVCYDDYELGTGTDKLEGELVASYDRFPLKLDLWGAWASASILRLDSTSQVFTADRRPAYCEYQAYDESSVRSLAEGCLDWQLADLAIHHNVLDIYFNRVLFDIGGRAAYFDDTFLSSAYARISFDTAAAVGMAAGGLRLFGELFYRFNETSPLKALGLRFYFQATSDDRTWIRPLKGGFE
jgi:hypothetical protein